MDDADPRVANGDGPSAGPEAADDLPEDPDIDDAIEELEELVELVDRDVEREQVDRTIRVLQRARRPRLVGRFSEAFGLGDAGEALVGAVVFGIPMIAEDGTLAIGAYVATRPEFWLLTVAFGLLAVVGILQAVDFAAVEEDLIAGLVPRRLVGILLIAIGSAALLMTVWGRVSWAEPWVATCQVTVTAVVMALGGAIGDILPE